MFLVQQLSYSLERQYWMRIWTKRLNKPFSLTWEGKVELELGVVVVVELELEPGVEERLVPVGK